jgi:hypothetical protein
MVSSQEMKGAGVRRINGFSHPLRTRLIDEACGAVTPGTRIATCVATNAGCRQILKIVPPLLWRHGFNLPHIGVTVNILFRNRFPQKLVVYDGVSMDAYGAIVLKVFGAVQGKFEPATGDVKLVA